jgi:hypothetical protein
VQARQIEALARDHRGAADINSFAAEIYARLGENDRAFAALDKARAARDPGFAWAEADPFLRSLHGDSRWIELLHNAGLVDDQLN